MCWQYVRARERENAHRELLTHVADSLCSRQRYRKVDPASSEEQEFVENLFTTLCACLLSPSCRPLFQQAEGLQLMLLFIKYASLTHRCIE